MWGVCGRSFLLRTPLFMRIVEMPRRGVCTSVHRWFEGGVMGKTQQLAIGVLTSGGDAQGMNAALRAVTRTALDRGARVYAICDGYRGMVEGGDLIRPLAWGDVSGILHRGGTVIGTARSQAFRTREGRLQAAQNLLERGIDRLAVIGGDGSLSGALVFRQEWPGLLEELVATQRVPAELAAEHRFLAIVGMVGSIDNDMVGTDMTIGADSALWRITEAIDALSSTASSHRRTFIVEVMGRNCGYLALMGAVAGGADWVLIPESPPTAGWEDRMCAWLQLARQGGRRDSIVVVAEGARDQSGNPISGEYVRQVLEQRLGEDTRLTILGHVQRGGAPSAFDRWMSTLIGYTAAEELLQAALENEPQLIGMRYNRITRVPLAESVAQTRAVAAKIAAHDYAQAMEARGGSFNEMFDIFRRLSQVPQASGTERRRRIAIVHAGGAAPGMNTAVRSLVRLGQHEHHAMLAVRGGVGGLIADDLIELDWTRVEDWVADGGAELGTNRQLPTEAQLADVARTLEQRGVEALLIIGGLTAYEAALQLRAAREHYPAFDIPMICMPAAIDNNIPGSELSIGADTAINTIVSAVDMIKQSAVAGHRCFVVEVLGHHCGYLALMSGLATGAERVYLPEEGITLARLAGDVEHIAAGFRAGKRLGLLIRSEDANPVYTTAFIRDLFQEEGHGLFDARQAVLGHMQQGGTPSPFDRVQATRLAAHCIAFLTKQLAQGLSTAAHIGFVNGRLLISDLSQVAVQADPHYRRPQEQWWLDLRPIAQVMAQSAPSAED